jgi:hypothetical protein
MIALLYFILAVVVSPLKSKSRLEAENAALRYQLIVLRQVVSASATPIAWCPYRKSNSNVLMVQSSEVWLGNDAANGLNSPRNRCILVQR